jgi:prevent-host-death family protein
VARDSTLRTVETVTAREFKAHMADYMRAAHEGRVVVITRHGRIDCALVPALRDSALVVLSDRATGPSEGGSDEED